MNNTFSTQHIDILVLGHEFRLPDLEKHLAKYPSQRFRDALHIDLAKGSGFLFDYGVIVTWGVNAALKQQLCKELESLTHEVHQAHEWHQFGFVITAGVAPSMKADEVLIPDGDENTLLAVSHALAQSAKLAIFETLAQGMIIDNRQLVSTLSATGNIPLNRKQLAKLRGSLFQAKSDILLNFSLLDTPEYFWDYPELESIYMVVSRYMDLRPRVELLSMKLATISELLEVLANEQNHKHSSLLEWIIILLIAVEIVLFFVH